MLVLLAAATSVPALAQTAGPPGYDRPGLGFTPSVLKTGDVILEQGLPDWSRDDGVSQYDADTLLRLGMGHALELQLGTGWSWQRGSGRHADGRADTVLAMKFAPASHGRFSWGLLGSVELTDGGRDFRGSRRYVLLGASAGWQHDAGRSTGLYAEVLRGDRNHQLLAVNQGWSWGPAVEAYTELGFQHVDHVGGGSMAGAGVTWAVTPRVQLDASLRHRLGGHADTWQGGIGMAVYFGR